MVLRFMVTVLISRKIHFSIPPEGHTSFQAVNLHTEGLRTYGGWQ
jgi:hypothetical protein